MTMLRIALLFVLFLTAAANAEPRLALVIGNESYAASPLANPAADAKLIAETLTGSGFEVETLIDADRKTMKQAIRDFSTRLAHAGPGAAAVFYFAGHGVQANGRNYLIPVAAEIDTAADLEFESVEAQWALDRIGESGVSLSMFILDACRNNPFRSMSRAGTRGLARMDAPTGSILSYSTAPGDAALDGTGANSPYTEALAAAMRRPGLKVEEVFKATRRSVVSATGGRQTPWESSSLIGDFYFRPGAAAPTPASGAVGGPAPGENFRDCPACPELTALAGGAATIGSRPDEAGHESHEAPPTRVEIRPFALARREVTRADYARFLGETGRAPPAGCWYLFGVWVFDAARSWRDPGFEQGDDHPVACVRWSDAVAYAEWLSATTGKRYRLPSEAEWEYAARRAPWGDQAARACGFGNVHDEAANAEYASGLVFSFAPCDDGYAATAPAGRFPANENGVFDLFGNASEWTADCWNSSHSGRAATGAARRDGDCGSRVVKGASWVSPILANRPAWRFKGIAKDPNVYLGFRVARDLP